MKKYGNVTHKYNWSQRSEVVLEENICHQKTRASLREGRLNFLRYPFML